MGSDFEGTFSGSYSETLTEMTDGNGEAVFVTAGCVKRPAYEFCVDDITDAALPYDSNDNVETCDTY